MTIIRVSIGVVAAIAMSFIATCTKPTGSDNGAFFDISERQAIQDSCRIQRNRIIDLVFTMDSQFQAQYDQYDKPEIIKKIKQVSPHKGEIR